jgi:diguanylate cyclase (GGDEF)-like protein/PAS domain S-box-containing protein
VSGAEKISGIHVDILKNIATKERWGLTFVSGNLTQGIERLKAGEIDILVPLAYSAERERDFDFNGINVVVNWGQIYTPKSKSMQSFLDLDGKVIAVVRNNIQYTAFKHMMDQFSLNPRYVEVDDFEKVFALLNQNKVDAGVVGRFFGMVNEGKYGVSPSPIVFNPIEVRYAFPKGTNPDLIQAIDRQLAAMKADPNSSYHQALEKYLQVVNKKGLPAWIKWVIIIIALLCTVVVALNAFLRHEIRQRTKALNKEFEDRRKAEDALVDSELKYRELVESANSIIIKFDAGGSITFFNEYAERFFGFVKEEIIGCQIIGTILPETESSGRILSNLIETMFSHPEQYLTHESEAINKDGSRYWISWSNRPLIDEHGVLIGMLSVGNDITERRAYEHQLVYQANYDLVTGLPNRNLLTDRLNHDITVFTRSKGFLGLLTLDIDNFKIINDTLGHDAGNQFLFAFSKRLLDVIRKSDTVARLGGDEFAILPVGLPNGEGAAVMAEKILSSLSVPFMVGERELYVTVSIGIASYPADGDTVELLLQNSEAAMYEAKKEGKNDFRFFTDDLNTKMHQRLALETSLHHALENNEFLLYYQPQVDTSTGIITGMEALIRWQRTDGSIVPPMEFIPSLEDSGLIVSVGEWVLETACRDAKLMSDKVGRALTLSVNISARQFSRSDIVEHIAFILEETGLKPESLRLELTESLLMGDTVSTLERLHKLKELGISLSIDDFGTGYSSLSYLKKLPISELKIDRAFIKNVPENKSDAVIVNTIITIAQCLDLDVVAEGVETEEQRQFLEKQKCPTFQGFLFSKPLPLEQFTRLFPAPVKPQ